MVGLQTPQPTVHRRVPVRVFIHQTTQHEGVNRHGIIRDVNIRAHEASSPSRKTSSARSSDSPKPTHAVLSIKPVYAEAIFAGKKRFEFRRSIFRQDIQVVIVYISSPVVQVVGEFSVEDIITDDVEALWDRTEARGDRSPNVFLDYFAGRTSAMRS